MLVEESRHDSPEDFEEGRPERTASARRTDARPFPSANQMRAFAYVTAQLNSTRRHVCQMKRTPTATSPGAPPIGPGGTVPPKAYDTQEVGLAGVNTSWPARRDRARMDATFASETQALAHVARDMRQTVRVPYADETVRGDTARGSGDPILAFDRRWGGYQPQDPTTHQGLVDIHTLPVTPFGTLGPATPGVEAFHTMIQELSAAADYRMYRLDNVSTLFTSGDAGRIAKSVQRCRGICSSMRNFDGTNAIELLPFLKDVRITFNSQHLTEGVAIRVLAHFLERDAERLYTSYTMRGIRPGQLHDNVSWPGPIN